MNFFEQTKSYRSLWTHPILRFAVIGGLYFGFYTGNSSIPAKKTTAAPVKNESSNSGKDCAQNQGSKESRKNSSLLAQSCPAQALEKTSAKGNGERLLAQ